MIALPRYSMDSIRARLLTMSFLSTAMVVVLLLSTILTGGYVLGRSGLLDDLRVQSDMIASQSTAAMMFNDAAAAGETLAALRALPTVQSAVLFDANGNSFASYSRNGQTAAKVLVQPANSEDHHFATTHLDVFRSVVQGPQRLGTLHLRADLKPLYLNLLGYAVVVLVLGLLALLFGFLVIGRLQRSISDPIVELAAITRAIAEARDYSVRAPETESGEIGALGRSFNEMLVQIETRERELAHELTERIRAEERLDRLAHFDTVTNLPNRYYFNERLADAVQRTNRFGDPTALLFIDLDNFKIVNDTLGHDVGDNLLMLVAARLSGVVRSGDSLCRIGGDEFAMILPNVADHAQAVHIAAKCIEAVSGPIDIEGSEIYVTVSIGISLCPKDASEAYDLLKQADTAMYHAKARGKNTYQVFLPEMRGKAQKRLILETSLRRAIERQEFVLHYQPQIDLASGKIVSLEALVRWQHPDLGLVSPLEFIPVAEETGLIVPIGEWVLRAACAQAADWARNHATPLRMAVNLSARQFRDDTLIEKVLKILRETGLESNLLELELTESTLMDAGPNIIERLQELRAAGIHLAIDDFGTGYSSMSYLKRFPVGMLKVDSSFVRDLPEDPDDAAITEAIIAMAHSLNIRVTAEGVETAAQAEFLTKAGCTLAQGSYYAWPLPANQVQALIEHRADTPYPSTGTVTHPVMVRRL
jgi:diguanylate cyclase